MKHLQVISIATVLALLGIVVMTVVGELWSPFKDFLASAFGHHWVGKGVLATGIFVVGSALAYPLSNPNDETLKGWLWTVVITATIAALALFGFFLWEYLA